MDNNQNMEIDFVTMTDEGKISHIKEYIQLELPGTSNNDLATNQDIFNKLEIIYSNIEGELIEEGIHHDEWLDNERYREIVEYKDFIEETIGQQPQQGGRKTKRKTRKSKRKSRKSKRKSRKSKRKSRKSKRK